MKKKVSCRLQVYDHRVDMCVEVKRLFFPRHFKQHNIIFQFNMWIFASRSSCEKVFSFLLLLLLFLLDSSRSLCKHTRLLMAQHLFSECRDEQERKNEVFFSFFSAQKTINFRKRRRKLFLHLISCGFGEREWNWWGWMMAKHHGIDLPANNITT